MLYTFALYQSVIFVLSFFYEEGRSMDEPLFSHNKVRQEKVTFQESKN